LSSRWLLHTSGLADSKKYAAKETALFRDGLIYMLLHASDCANRQRTIRKSFCRTIPVTTPALSFVIESTGTTVFNQVPVARAHSQFVAIN
jgi:hypothetical protein